MPVRNPQIHPMRHAERGCGSNYTDENHCDDKPPHYFL